MNGFLPIFGSKCISGLGKAAKSITLLYKFLPLLRLSEKRKLLYQFGHRPWAAFFKSEPKETMKLNAHFILITSLATVLSVSKT